MKRPTTKWARVLAGIAVTSAIIAAAWHLLGPRLDPASLSVVLLLAGGAGVLAANRLGGAFLLLAGAAGALYGIDRAAQSEWLSLAAALGLIAYLALLRSMVLTDALATGVLSVLATVVGVAAAGLAPAIEAERFCSASALVAVQPAMIRPAPTATAGDDATLVPPRLRVVLAEARAPLDRETVENKDFEAGRHWARADLAHGMPALHGVGLEMTREFERRYAMELGHRYGVNLDPRHGCPSFPAENPSVAFRMGYNGTMRVAIEARFGPRVWHEAGRRARLGGSRAE